MTSSPFRRCSPSPCNGTATRWFRPPMGPKRLNAALRRSGMARQDSDDERPIEVRGLKIDPGKRAVSRNGDTVSTTYVEFEILAALARSPGRVFTRDMLLSRVWGDSAY